MSDNDEYNPFIDDEEEIKEEKVYVKKPYQKDTLTEAQKERNLKGIKMVQETLEKIIPRRVL